MEKEQILNLIRECNKRLKPDLQWFTDESAVESVKQDLEQALDQSGSAYVELLSYQTISGHTEKIYL